jgi:membrane fusion protein (multidrug efflux system)
MNSKRNRILVPVAILLAIGVGWFTYESLTWVSTDDAEVGAHVVLLSARVAGTVQKVMVDENQKVKAGDVLAQIDTSDYSNASDAAKAQMDSLEARYKEAEVNYRRATDLFANQAIARERYDNALATYKELDARIKAAKAQLSQADLNVSYTKIIAPADGQIARKSVEPGQYVPAGQALFGFVASKERWVTANLKETELNHVRIGSHAEVSVDAVSGHKYTGEVESISPSTGAIFSLLPPDNSTGNFTKVVQRVPVRVKLAGLNDEDVDRLQAGLSAVVSIRIR